MKDRLVAHRGNAADFRENSLDAIRSAIELGVPCVEFDVQMSADAVPCLSHDANLRRLYGRNQDTANTLMSEMQSLGIASLREAIDLIGRHAVTAFVEIKKEGTDRFGREKVASIVFGLLTSQCVVISFDPLFLNLARSRGLRIGLVLRDMSDATQEICNTLVPEYIFCDQRHICGKVWAGPIWVCYEVSDTGTAERLISHGVDLLETMQVRRMSVQ